MTTANTTATLNAETRTNAGKGVARALRRAGKVPAVIYSAGKEATSLALVANDVRQQYLKGRFRSRVLELAVDGKQKVKVLPRDVQFHPVTDQIEHVDFLKVEAGTTVRVAVPVKFLGMDKSVGLKRGGVLNVVRHDIEFICKPEAIPASIEVDVTAMDIGHSVHINDVKLPAGIEAVIKRNFTIATIAGRSKEEEATETTAAATTAAAAPAAADAAKAAEPAKKDEKK